jgi:hypothetical protein
MNYCGKFVTTIAHPNNSGRHLGRTGCIKIKENFTSIRNCGMSKSVPEGILGHSGERKDEGMAIGSNSGPL